MHPDTHTQFVVPMNSTMLQTVSRKCSTLAVHKQIHSGVHHTSKQQAPPQHHLPQTQLLQRAGGSLAHSDVPLCIPPSAFGQHSVTEAAPVTDRRQLLLGSVGGIVAAGCQCCMLSPAQAEADPDAWVYGETCMLHHLCTLISAWSCQQGPGCFLCVTGILHCRTV